MKYTYPFTEAEFKAASDAWGCNCGPGALAFACQISLDRVRAAIPDFDAKRYTSPTMMIAAIAALGRRHWPEVVSGREFPERLFPDDMSLVRIQWTGPWTAPGANPKWAYRQTHWIASWWEPEQHFVFDINGGLMTVDRWKAEIVPLITAHVPRADGGWKPTHVWRLIGGPG